METVQVSGFQVVGLTTVTQNVGDQAAIAIGGMMQRFMGEGLMQQIPHRLSDEVVSVYCEYEGDYTQPYRVVLGCKVSQVGELPEGMYAITIPDGTYTPFIAAGDLTQGVVAEEWGKIWDTPLDRAYQADFEVYGERAQNIHAAEVDIFIGLRG